MIKDLKQRESMGFRMAVCIKSPSAPVGLNSSYFISVFNCYYLI